MHAQDPTLIPSSHFSTLLPSHHAGQDSMQWLKFIFSQAALTVQRGWGERKGRQVPMSITLGVVGQGKEGGGHVLKTAQ